MLIEHDQALADQLQRGHLWSRAITRIGKEPGMATATRRIARDLGIGLPDIIL